MRAIAKCPDRRTVILEKEEAFHFHLHQPARLGLGPVQCLVLVYHVAVRPGHLPLQQVLDNRVGMKESGGETTFQVRTLQAPSQITKQPRRFDQGLQSAPFHLDMSGAKRCRIRA